MSEPKKAELLALARRAQKGLPAEVLSDRVVSEVVDSALEVQAALGPFYAAAIYRNALAAELRRRGVRAHKSVAISVAYRGEVVGSYEADLVVDDQLLLRISADGQLDARLKDHVLRGLGAAGLKLGLVIDFGQADLQFARIL